MNATSVISASIHRPSPSVHRVGYSNLCYEATCRFTCVTACSLAVWKLTTLNYSSAASSYYRGVRTTPRTGLQPARFTAVTANGQTTVFSTTKINILINKYIYIFYEKPWSVPDITKPLLQSFTRFMMDKSNPTTTLPLRPAIPARDAASAPAHRIAARSARLARQSNSYR